ncbi:MAG: gamma-glutamyl-gamma-aminobutyrate hydrolase family protein [Planctomycetota bacterium]|nr:gamma-glutamyl-gamma-aminobutyrate hydrolase family protein [Planctomycetota bacterium]
MQRPLIGITVDNKNDSATSNRYESSIHYSRGIALAGGLPLLLPQEPALAEEYVALCDGILLTGGSDPRMERFGKAMHPEAKPVDAGRQEFELAVLAALDRAAGKPALGVCLGMQFMALHAGGNLNQHLPETLATATDHQRDNRHAIRVLAADSVVLREAGGAGASENAGGDLTVVSWHHQAVNDAGRLRTVAVAPDGVIEAIDDPSRKFYLGVQWHPERGGDGRLNRDLLRRFVASCLAGRSGS